MTTAPTWYDLLDVEPTASTDEIRAAWKNAVADLDPTDRRFQRLSEAATVLLDEQRRKDYDDSLASAAGGSTRVGTYEDSLESAAGGSTRVGKYDDSLESAAGGSSLIAASDEQPAASRVGGTGPERSEDRIAPTRRPWRAWRAWRARRPARPRRTPPTLRALTTSAVVALALVTLAAWSWTRPDPKSVESDAAAAREAAERAVVPVLSYDYRRLAEGQKDAESHLTTHYRDKAFRPLFATIKQNAPGTEAVVTTKVVESAVVRAGEDRVEVLVLVDRPTTNRKQNTPVTYEDHVTVTMEKIGGGWLIDDMTT